MYIPEIDYCLKFHNAQGKQVALLTGYEWENPQVSGFRLEIVSVTFIVFLYCPEKQTQFISKSGLFASTCIEKA